MMLAVGYLGDDRTDSGVEGEERMALQDDFISLLKVMSALLMWHRLILY